MPETLDNTGMRFVTKCKVQRRAAFRIPREDIGTHLQEQKNRHHSQTKRLQKYNIQRQLEISPLQQASMQTGSAQDRNKATCRKINKGDKDTAYNSNRKTRTFAQGL